MPAPLGSSRDGLGLRSRSIWRAEKPTKTANTIDSQKVGSRPAIWAPIREPTRIPGARSMTTGHSTAPRLWWARTDDSDVNRIVASEVAIAMCTMCSSGYWRQVKSSVRKGTSSMPPPIPSRPAANPVAVPRTSRAMIRPMSISAVPSAGRRG